MAIKGALIKTHRQAVVSEIMMGSPVTVAPDATLDFVNDVISLSRIRHIPVVDHGVLVGLLRAPNGSRRVMQIC
jgi:CBS domain-containing protein